jgi:2-dehydro-3-deoxyglucarate aldolase/4-hydroxy-2-oxoheptanedioate aldolase
MSARTLRDLLGTRSAKLGHFVMELDVPGIGHILRSAGCDFTVVDMEHSGFGIDTIRRVLRYTEAAELPTIVRVPSSEYHHIARVLDLGAEGVMVPMVEDAAHARRIVESMKYWPEGRRGVGLGIAHDRYEPGPSRAKLAAANRRTTLFAQIETLGGLDRVSEIAAVDGVDCLWVGQFDLSVSLGLPAEFEHPTFRAALEQVTAAGRAAGKSLGRVVPDVATGAEQFQLGFDFLCYATDAALFRNALADGITALRGACDRDSAHSGHEAASGA